MDLQIAHTYVCDPLRGQRMSDESQVFSQLQHSVNFVRLSFLNRSNEDGLSGFDYNGYFIF